MRPDVFQQIATLDWIGLALVVILLVLGLVRGLWWQVIRLLGVVLAIITARLFAADGAAFVTEAWPEVPSRLAHGASWVGIFGLTLAATAILGHLGQRMLEAMQLGFANRMAGALVGAATGLTVHMTLMLAISLLTTEQFVERHVAGTYSQEIYRAVGDRWQVVLGSETARELEDLFERAADPEKRQDGARPVEAQSPRESAVPREANSTRDSSDVR